jgi:hypothetical protein
MRKSLRLTLLLLFTISVGCQSQGTSVVTQEKSYVQSWEQKTLSKLHLSQNANFGYSNFIEEREPSLYDTYYNVLILQKYDIDYEENKLVAWVTNKLEKENFEIRELADIQRIYYLLGLSHQLNIPLENYQSKILEQLIKIKQTDGYYVLEKYKNDFIQKIIQTNFCIEVLSFVNSPYSDPILFEELSEVLKTNEFTKITNYKWSIINTIINIQHRMFNTNYFISDEGQTIMSTIISEGKNILNHNPEEKIQLLNYTNIYKLLKITEQNLSLPSGLINYINQSALPDYGFNVISNQWSDPQLTLDVLDMYPNSGYKNLFLYTENIKKHQLPDGGFTSNMSGNSTIKRTFMGIKINKVLNLHTQDSVKNFILSYENSNVELNPQDKYYLAESKSILRMHKSEIEIKPNENKSEMNLQDIYNGCLYETNSQRIDVNDKIKQILNSKKVESRELFLLTEINRICNHQENFNRNLINEWAKYGWESDGGFSFGERSNLKDTYYALLMMHNNSIIIDPLNVKKFIDQFRVSSGGYSSEKSSNKASLEHTFYALETLDLINNTDSKEEHLEKNAHGY